MAGGGIGGEEPAAGGSAEPASLPTVRRAARRAAAPGNALVRFIAEARLPGARGRYVDFLPDAEAILQPRHSPYATWLIATLSLMVVAAVAWMHFARLEEVAMAPGIVRAASGTAIVSHPDGGRVAKIAVGDGDTVQQGQPLVLLDDQTVTRRIAQLASLHAALVAEVARLESEMRDSSDPPVFPAALDGHVTGTQLQLWHARQVELDSRRRAADALVEQTRTRMTGLRERLRAAEDSPDAPADQNPAGLGIQPGHRSSELAALRDSVQRAEQAHAEALERRTLVDRTWHAAILSRLADAALERDRTWTALQQQELARHKLVLRAPVGGVVVAIAGIVPGAAVAPGEPVIAVTPTVEARRLEVEARVSGRDIALVAVGQDATVKFQAYDWQRYGTVRGKVVQIGAAMPVSERAVGTPASPLFAVRIALDQDFMGDDPRRNRLRPGMTAVVELPVGRQSILGLLTAGFRRAVAPSLHDG